MSSVRIEERFEIDAPPQQVWEFLIDPERVVVCLPGAVLEEVRDEKTFLGSMKVKVGPVSVAYRGTMVFLEVDHEARRIRMEGKGREKGGAGSAKMVMTSTVTELPGGGAAVTVEADLTLAGKIVRFGRGMIQGVSAELFKQFTERMAGRMKGEGAEGAPGAGDGGTPPTEGSSTQEPSTPSTASGVEPSSSTPEPVHAEAARQTGAGAPTDSAADGGAAQEPTASLSKPSAASPAEPEALNLVSLLLRTLWSWIRRLFGGR